MKSLSESFPLIILAAFAEYPQNSQKNIRKFFTSKKGKSMYISFKICYSHREPSDMPFRKKYPVRGCAAGRVSAGLPHLFKGRHCVRALKFNALYGDRTKGAI